MRLLTASLALLLIGTVGSIASANNSRTIAEFVAGSGDGLDRNPFDYDLLNAALVAAELDGALGDASGAFTLFAPNDLAFIRLARDLGYRDFDEAGALDFILATLATLGDGDPLPLLTDVLLYHVVPEPLDFSDVFIASLLGKQVVTLQGGSFQPFFVVLIDNEPDLRNPRLFFPVNIGLANGVLHTINRVLLPIELP